MENILELSLRRKRGPSKGLVEDEGTNKIENLMSDKPKGDDTSVDSFHLHMGFSFPFLRVNDLR